MHAGRRPPPRFNAWLPNAARARDCSGKPAGQNARGSPADKSDGRSSLTAAATTAVLDEDLQRKARIGAQKIIMQTTYICWTFFVADLLKREFTPKRMFSIKIEGIFEERDFSEQTQTLYGNKCCKLPVMYINH
ncbi:MAG: hypothetical protein JJU02_11605 [Cryomorphaceae bacterium]|nr:hypothetical protein [Cryomorphaceae bacterium]